MQQKGFFFWELQWSEIDTVDEHTKNKKIDENWNYEKIVHFSGFFT